MPSSSQDAGATASSVDAVTTSLVGRSIAPSRRATRARRSSVLPRSTPARRSRSSCSFGRRAGALESISASRCKTSRIRRCLVRSRPPPFDASGQGRRPGRIRLSCASRRRPIAIDVSRDACRRPVIATSPAMRSLARERFVRLRPCRLAAPAIDFESRSRALMGSFSSCVLAPCKCRAPPCAPCSIT